jgi:hypothetical protein
MYSSAVPVLLASNYTAFGTNGTAGTIFGILLLAGHGVSFSSNQLDLFISGMSTFVECPVAPQYATWAPGLTLLLQFSTHTVVGSTLQLGGVCSSDAVLTLQSSPSLSKPVWTNATIKVIPNGESFTCIVPLTSTPLFYRMIDSSR